MLYRVAPARWRDRLAKRTASIPLVLLQGGTAGSAGAYAIRELEGRGEGAGPVTDLGEFDDLPAPVRQERVMTPCTPGSASCWFC
jgi:hypothetical protein